MTDRTHIPTLIDAAYAAAHEMASATRADEAAFHDYVRDRITRAAREKAADEMYAARREFDAAIGRLKEATR